MAGRYGHRWTSAYGDEPNEFWREETAELTEQQWLQGIQRVKDCTDEWPPTLPQFLNWCLGVLTEKEAKAQALLEYENRPPQPYSPWNPGKTYSQLESERREYIAKRVVELTTGARGQALGVAHDPLRICRDEAYR